MATNNAINTDTNSFCETANNLSDVATPATARLNLYVPTAVNSATILTASDYGKEVICTGAAAYSLTLPTVTSNANKFIDIYCQTTSNALVTVTPASGTISGQSTIVLGSGDGIRVQNDGTNWWVLNVWLQPCWFRISRSGTQTINNNTDTVIQYDSVSQVGGFYNSGTFRFTPLLPGLYEFSNTSVYNSEAFAFSAQESSIFFNLVKTTRNVFAVPASSIFWVTTTELARSMNGSTDYIEFSTRQQNGGAANATLNASVYARGRRASLF